MVFTIERVNANITLLPNISIGFDIYDSCSYDAVALQASLQMVPLVVSTSVSVVSRSGSVVTTSASVVNTSASVAGTSTFVCNVSEEAPAVIGMVGAQRSSSTMQAALVLGRYQIPQVSFLSTSDELSNVDRYPYFLRTVAPDRFQVRVMIDILRHFGWKYVSFLNSDDSFGKSAQRAFRQQAEELDICLGIVRTISLYADHVTYDQVIFDLLNKSTTKTTVVLLFAQLETVYGILSAATRANAYRSFIWIGGDGWGNYNDLEGVQDYINAAIGAFTVAPLSQTLPDYDAHFNTKVQDHHNNPWLEEFWTEYGNCSVNSSYGDEGISIGWCDPPTSSVHETLVMDSTLAFVYALDRMHRDKCRNSTISGVCDELRNALRSAEALDYLLQTEFDSPANGRIKFNEAGDGGGKYAVFNLQWKKDTNQYAFVRVGTWDGSASDGEALTLEMVIPWYLQESQRFDTGTGFPKSICSEACELGYKTSFSSENPCCWTCTKCQSHERTFMNGTACESCVDEDNEIYTWPSNDFTRCEEIKPVVNLRENPWASVMIVLSGLGMIFTVILIIFYCVNREKRLIKASSRELSCLIFTGIMLSYITSMLYILPPHPVICALVRLGPPIGNSLVYVSVAVKTIRLYRIFMAGKKSVKRPKFISPTSQVSITLGLCLVPITWMTIWLILVPPEVILDMPDQLAPRVERTCSQGLPERIGTMIWDLVLVFVCCVYAFRTRKLPNNYKESRFIAFCVFSTLLVLLAFSPTIFTTREPFYRSVYSALGLIVIATVANLCLFLIKFYALYFVSEKDLVLSTSNEQRRSIESNGIKHASTDAAAMPNRDLLSIPDNNKPGKTSPVVSKRKVGVVSSFSSLNPHMPPLESDSRETELQERTGNASEGDVNLGFEADEDDEGAYDLDDEVGGVYCGPTETIT
ncbi:metabotropic glutamate receptor 3-like [Amphiura filiformis]|uniref:metabotropic glutamate receptor 3-like n=1 Tax=Amphiura filiformis TaxID=82378 RepID=UPI003B220DFB